MLDAIESSFVWTRAKYVLRHATCDASAWISPALVAGLSYSLYPVMCLSLLPLTPSPRCFIALLSLQSSAARHWGEASLTLRAGTVWNQLRKYK